MEEKVTAVRGYSLEPIFTFIYTDARLIIQFSMLVKVKEKEHGFLNLEINTGKML